MKKLNFKVLATAFATAIIVSACGGVDKMKEAANSLKINVTPKILVEKGGKVTANISINIPEKYVNKAAILETKAFIVYEGGEVELGTKTIQGEKVQDNNMVINSKTGGSYNVEGTVDYVKEMRNSRLEIRFVAKIKDKELPFVYDGKVADGVISTSQLVENGAQPIIMSHDFERVTSEVQKADILYMINQAALRNSELKKEDVKLLQKFIKDVKANERKELKAAKVSSYASPDGELKLNERVSSNREKTANRFINKELKRAKIKDANVETTTVAEDWDGFKELMQASEISDKELILRVLSMYSDPVVREKEIKNLSAAFTEVAEKILPKLRRSQLFVEANITGYSDEEIMALVESDFASLKEVEKLYAATLYTDLNKKLDIYTKAHQAHPESIRAINNMAYILIEQGKLDEAKANLDKALALNESHPVVLNNLGVIALKKNEIEKAEGLFNKATEAGEAVQNNLGIVYIIKGEYANAITKFGVNDSFNKGLALVLANKNADAIATLSNVKEQTAMVDYVKAIAYAKNADEANMLASLQAAFEKDASLKAFAKTDLEFANYFEMESFKGIVM
ncbi:MAG: tetratricopeptide repeat protein [Bacteroidales bacterium]|nr:tetratricopeptide repeat protein [Bacteroidales bacterium]